MPGVSAEQVKLAREVDLLSYLQINEPHELRRSAPGEYRTVTHGSLVISNGKWVWNRGGFGGRTALDYLIKIRGMGFVEAVETVLGSRSSLSFSALPVKDTKPPRQKDLVMPSVRRYTTYAYNYLLKRGISADVLGRCIQSGLLYEGRYRGEAVCVFGNILTIDISKLQKTGGAMLTQAQIKMLKQVNVSKNADKTRARIQQDYKAASKQDKQAIDELSGQARNVVYRVFKTGTVCIHHRQGEDRWCGQVTIGYNDKGKPIRKTFYGNTREEVARKVTEAANQAFNGTFNTPVLPCVSTVEKMITDFLWTFKRPTVSDVTFDWYLNVTKTHIIPSLGTVPVDKLTPYMVQTLFNHMHDEKRLAARTVKGVRDILNQAYVHAVEMKLATMNPVSGTKLPKRSRVKSEAKEDDKVIPVNARAEILRATEKDLRMRTAITVLMFTGMRVGEWLALTWGQVDFQNSVITIDRAITKTCEYNEDGDLVERKTVVGDTKTQCSVRKIKASSTVTAVLKEWREALPKHMKSSVKLDLLSAGSVVFPNDMGQMRTYNGFRTTYRRFMAENSLGNYSLHSYRHTFATMLLERGINPKVVQKLLGHRDIETTLGTYSHVLPEIFDGVAGIVGELHADMITGDGKSVSIH